MKRIAVYCGASKGNDPSYMSEAYQLGKIMAEKGYELIFGAGSVGIMGAIQDGVLDHGGSAIGVMPNMLNEKEITSQKLTELILVDSMHERKNKMAELADAFVMAPGGAGSLEEFFEIYTWAQIGLHHKPIGALNTNQFFKPMQSMIEHLISTGFVSENYKNLAIIKGEVPELFDALQVAEPVKLRDYQK